MSATARSAWLDAWEGTSTPSPRRAPSRRSHRNAYPRERHARDAGERARGVGSRVPAGEHRSTPLDSWRPDYGNASEWMGSVVRISEARGARRKPVSERRVEAVDADIPPIRDYDWDAAARRRPRADECERVILHTDRSVEARISNTRYYGREATARKPLPRVETVRRTSQPRMRVVRSRTPVWRLRILVGVFAALIVGLTVISPIVINSAAAGLEAAVGQAEATQEQMAAEAAALSSQITSLSSPQRVAEQAEQLGLVPADQVSYLATGDQLLASEGDTTVAGR